jgi:Aldose 1-epimerase
MTSPAIKTIPLGASIYSFKVGGHEILLTYPDPALHGKLPHPFFGETIGRVANRIENATLANLNGQTYHLNANNGPNTLHGGNIGWGKAQWKGPTFVRKGSWDAGISAVSPEGWKEPGGSGREGVKYEHLSPHGDEHFPGAVKATVWYFEGRNEDGKVVLDSEYEVQFAGDTPGVEETVVGMTNHRYASRTDLCITVLLLTHPATSTSIRARRMCRRISRIMLSRSPPPSIRRLLQTPASPMAHLLPIHMCRFPTSRSHSSTKSRRRPCQSTSASFFPRANRLLMFRLIRGRMTYIS